MTHHCIARYSCRATTLVNDGGKQATVVTHSGELCERCAAHAKLSALWLCGTYDQLHAMIGERSASDVTVKAAAGPQVPINLQVEAKMAAIAELPDCAAQMARGPRLQRLERLRVATQSYWLYRNFGTLLACPSMLVPRWFDEFNFGTLAWSGHEMALAMWQLNTSAANTLGTRSSDMRRRYLAHCPRCGMQALGRDYGSDVITCSSCPSGTPGWTEQQYARLAGYIIWEREQDNAET